MSAIALLWQWQIINKLILRPHGHIVVLEREIRSLHMLPVKTNYNVIVFVASHTSHIVFRQQLIILAHEQIIQMQVYVRLYVCK